jgi:hypothetical protein
VNDLFTAQGRGERAALRVQVLQRAVDERAGPAQRVGLLVAPGAARARRVARRGASGRESAPDGRALLSAGQAGMHHCRQFRPPGRRELRIPPGPHFLYGHPCASAQLPAASYNREHALDQARERERKRKRDTIDENAGNSDVARGQSELQRVLARGVPAGRVRAALQE